MKIYINQANFLIDEFDKYKSKLYVHMRKENYEMSHILSFINGYMLIVELCSRYVLDIVMAKGYTPISNFKTVLFDSYEDVSEKLLNRAADDASKVVNKCDEWEKIGIKYALCFAKFYIKDIVFGDDIYVEDSLYMDIPNEYALEWYDWEERGYDFNI